MSNEKNLRTVLIDGIEFSLTPEEQIESLKEFDGNYKQEKKDKKED